MGDLDDLDGLDDLDVSSLDLDDDVDDSVEADVDGEVSALDSDDLDLDAPPDPLGAHDVSPPKFGWAGRFDMPGAETTDGHEIISDAAGNLSDKVTGEAVSRN